jgi:hypothetical protein
VPQPDECEFGPQQIKRNIVAATCVIRPSRFLREFLKGPASKFGQEPGKAASDHVQEEFGPMRGYRGAMHKYRFLLCFYATCLPANCHIPYTSDKVFATFFVYVSCSSILLVLGCCEPRGHLHHDENLARISWLPGASGEDQRHLPSTTNKKKLVASGV